MDTITAVRNRILQLCGEHEISINKLATISALPPSSIKNILYGKSQNPKLITIKMICDGLGITLGEFFSTPEFDALDQEIKRIYYTVIRLRKSLDLSMVFSFRSLFFFWKTQQNPNRFIIGCFCWNVFPSILSIFSRSIWSPDKL